MFKCILLFISFLIFNSCTHAPNINKNLKDEHGFYHERSISQAEKVAPYSTHCTPKNPSHPDRSYCAYFAPTDMPILVVSEYLKKAKKKIRISTYSINVDWYSEILNKKAEEGVQIEFLVDYKLSYDSEVWKNVKPHKNVTKYRIPVLRGGNPQQHNKVIIIDDETVIFGSANFTFSGLVGNYENILAVKNEPSILKSFQDELDEFLFISKSACEIFLENPDQHCGQATEKQDDWDKSFHELATTGKLSPRLLMSEKKCEVYRYGLLNEGNQPKGGTLSEIKGCFKDQTIGEKFEKLAKAISENEKYVDGKLVHHEPPQYKKPRYEPKIIENSENRVYFSGEDDIEFQVLKELRKTYETGKNKKEKNDHAKKSFAYISTNFITNRSIAQEVVRMKEAGVRLRVFFDRGRYEDPNFQSALSILRPLGVSFGEKDVSDNVVSIFNTTLSGPYSCNHNKMAVIYTPSDGLSLLNGSANWSTGAMKNNDENLLFSNNQELGLIYLNEIFSQLFVYRYTQDFESPGFKEDLDYLLTALSNEGKTSWKSQCFRALLGLQESCKTQSGVTWKPENKVSSNLFAVKNVEMKNGHQNLWAWVPELNSNQGGAIQAFTEDAFSGKWVFSIPIPLNWDFKFKFFTAPKNYDAIKYGPYNDGWELRGDRFYKSNSLTLHKVHDSDLEFGK